MSFVVQDPSLVLHELRVQVRTLRIKPLQDILDVGFVAECCRSWRVVLGLVEDCVASAFEFLDLDEVLFGSWFVERFESLSADSSC